MSRYEADLSSPANTKQCFCRAEDECPPKGTIDLYKCAGTPMFMSMPHFYMGDEKLLNNIESGLNPDKEKHGIYLMFEGVRFVVGTTSFACCKISIYHFLYPFFLANWKCFGSSKALSVQFRGETNSRYWSNERYARSVVPIVLGWRRRTTGTRIYWPNKKLTLFVSKKGLFDLRIASNLDDSIAFQNDENRQNREVGDDYWRCSWMVCRNS